MNIKMIVTDLDGTLLRDDKTVSERTKSVLRSCHESGIKVVYATARSDSTDMLVSSDLIDGKITTNGALAYDGEELVYKRLIAPEKLWSFLSSSAKSGLRTAAQASGRHYANYNVSEAWSWIHNFIVTDFETLSVPIEKAYVLVDTPEDVDFLQSIMPPDLYMTVSRDGMAQFMHPEAIKSRAIAALARHWDIDMKEVAAFGDDLNDIDMLKACGFGVAMENALDEVKTAANYVTASNNNDGVAVWIEEYLK